MKKLFSLLTLLLLLCTSAWGASGDVLFTQSFGGDGVSSVAYDAPSGSTAKSRNITSLTGIVGTGSNLFSNISCSIKKGDLAINSSTGGNSTNATGFFQAYSNGDNAGYWSITRTADFAVTAPKALKVNMDIWYKNLSSGSENGVQFAIGDDFTDGLVSTSAQSSSNVHSGFAIYANSSATLKAYNDKNTSIYNTAINQSAWLSITWIINNSGETLTYDNPTGSGTSTVANDCYDIWLKTQAGAASTYTRIAEGKAATTATKDMQNIYIGYNQSGKKHEFRLDNVVVTDLTPASCASQCATPEISPATGATFSGASQTITLSCATDDATIYYTLDGTTPTESSDAYDPAHKPAISSTTTVKAIAVKASYDNSDVATSTITKINTNSYSFNYSEGKTIAELESAGWTFNSATFDADPADTEAYVNLVSAMNTAGLTAPKSNSMQDNAIAFAKNAGAYAMYDLGAAKTIYSISATLYGGSGSAFNQTIEYIDADGTTVKKTYTNSLGAGNWKANSITKNEAVDGVRYIKIYGASKWVVMYDFSVTYDVTVPVSTLANRNYGTMITPANMKLDFANATGAKAFIATSLSGDVVNISSVDVVPAGTPIIIWTATAGATVNVPVTAANASSISGNLLVEGDGTVIEDEPYNYYYLAGDLFHQATSGELKAGKAYLDLSGAGAPSIIRLEDEENNATDIQSIESADKAIKFFEDGKLFIMRDGVVYDALGRIIR